MTLVSDYSFTLRLEEAVVTVIEGEENVRNARILALKCALSLELKGMKRRGRSAYAIVKDEFGFKGSKQKVYDQLCEWVKKHLFS